MNRKLLFGLFAISYAFLFSVSYMLFQSVVFPMLAVILLNAGLYGGYRFVYGSDFRVINKFLFLGINLLVSGFLLFMFPSLGNLLKLVYIAGTGLFVYFLLLAINIYVVSERTGEHLPLLHASKVVVFMAFVYSVFAGSTIIYKLNFFLNPGLLNLALKIILFLIFYAALIYSFQFFLRLEKIGEISERDELSIKHLLVLSAVILWQFAIVTMFYNFEAFGRAALVSVVAYILVNYIQNYMIHRVGFGYYLDSAVIFVTTYLAIFFL